MISEQEDTQWFDKDGFWEAFIIKPNSLPYFVLRKVGFLTVLCPI